MDRIRLPIGRTDFREIREGSCYYIDKTENIGRIIRDGAKSILFTRPRRFGKTTFQSMLRAFFDIREDSRDIFSHQEYTMIISKGQSEESIPIDSIISEQEKNSLHPSEAGGTVLHL